MMEELRQILNQGLLYHAGMQEQCDNRDWSYHQGALDVLEALLGDLNDLQAKQVGIPGDPAPPESQP